VQGLPVNRLEQPAHLLDSAPLRGLHRSASG
jgi:hypothetical protein